MTSVMDKMRGFVARLAPDPVCEACIVARLELPEPDAAGLTINRLVGTDGFALAASECTLCGAAGTHIHKAR